MDQVHSRPDAVHGGQKGHWLRRMTHLLLAGVPFLYYDIIPFLREQYAFVPHPVLVALFVGGALLVFEAIRLRRGIIVVGQRQYERGRISGAAWSVIGGLIVLLVGELLPDGMSRELAYPVFFTAALVDPIAGELRRRGARTGTVMLGTVACASAVWAGFGVVFHLRLLVPTVAVLVTAAVEGPRTAPVDDNLTLLLLPWLSAVLCRVAWG